MSSSLEDYADQKIQDIPEKERRNLYRFLANQMVYGWPLSPEETSFLAYGLTREVSNVRPIELEGLLPTLYKMEKDNPGSTQVDKFQELVWASDAPAEIDPLFDELLTGVVTFCIGGAAVGLTKAVGIGGKGLLTSQIGRVLASEAGLGKLGKLGILGGVASIGAVGGMLALMGDPSQQMSAAAGGEGISGGEGIPDDEWEKIKESGEITNEQSELISEAQIEELQEGDIFIVGTGSGATTSTAGGDPALIGDRILPTSYHGVEEYFGAPDYLGGTTGQVRDPLLIAIAESLDLDPLEFEPDDQDINQINPLYFGEIQVPFLDFPYGVDISTGMALSRPRHREDLPESLSKYLPEEDRVRYEVEKAFVPPTGQINPRAFATYQGQTLMELVAEAAVHYNIPVELLYGLINAESGFITNAMTPDGTRVGLAQIDLAEYEYLTPAQATNPRFSIGWAGRSLASDRLKYGSTPAAVVAQFSADDAEYLMRTGEFENVQAAQFVEDVYGYAGSSGMGQMMYKPGQLPPTRTVYRGGSGSGAPKIPPYQAPDPDTLRQITRITRREALERDPLDDEYTGDIAKLNAWYREKYNADVARLQGKTSTAVDPQAKYEEYIRGLGEFEYREESRDTSEVMDFMGEIVRIMQGV